MRDFNKIDEIFREGLKDHEVVPSYKNWYKIEQKLPAQDPVYKTGYFWAAFSSFICIAIFATFMIYFFHNYSIQISSKNAKLADVSAIIETNSFTEILKPLDANNDCLGQAVSNLTLTDLENNNAPLNITVSSDNAVQAESIIQPEEDVKAETIEIKAEIIEHKILQEKIKLVASSDNTKKVKPSISSGKWVAFLNKLNLYKKVEDTLFDENSISSEYLSDNYKSASTNNSAYYKKLDPRNIEVPKRQPLNYRYRPIATSPTFSIEQSGWYAGSFFQYQGNIPYSKQNKESMSEVVQRETSTANERQKLLFGNAYGVALGYNFNENFGIQTEVTNAIQGAFEEDSKMVNDGSEPVVVKYYYTQIPLMFKYRYQLNKKIKKPIMMSHLVGFQYGIRKNSPNLFEEFGAESDQLLNDNNLGFILGMDYDFFLSRKTSFTFGARSILSKNFNTMSQYLNSQSTFDVLVGVNASLKFSLNRNK